MMGTGEADGDNRAIEAAEKAISNPLLDGVSMKGAKGVIISITGGEDMRLMEVDEAASHIKELVDPDANIIWGSAFNNDLDGKIRVSVVATGIEAEAVHAPQPGKVFAFPRTTTATPVAAVPITPVPATTPVMEDEAEEEDTLELTDEAEDGDELLLDSDDVLTTPVGSAPIEPPVDEEELTAEETPAEEKPKHLLDAQFDPALMQKLRETAAAQHLAVDEHPVAVEDDQVGIRKPGFHPRMRSYAHSVSNRSAWVQ